jgi:hypothetical protein
MAAGNGTESVSCLESQDTQYTQLNHIRTQVAGHIAKFIHEWSSGIIVRDTGTIVPAEFEYVKDMQAIRESFRRRRELHDQAQN